MEIRPLLSALWRNRTGPLMVAAQIAITLMILVNVAYVVAVRIEISNRPTGIDIDNIFWVLSEGYSPDYSHANTTKADLQYLNSIPGVVAASVSSDLPQTFSGIRLEISSEPARKGNKAVSIIYQMSERAVETLGLNLEQGRSSRAEVIPPIAADMNASLSNLAPEVVITRALAAKLFGEGNALGKTIYFGLINRSSTIVGIVERMQAAPYYTPDADFVESVVMVPAIPPGPSALYLVRTEPGRRDEIMAKIEKEFEATQSGRYIDRIETFARTAALTRATNRVSAIVLAIVAVLVAAVTALGLFGLAAFTVTSRTKQIGTRRAFGARKFHILRYFLVENWLITTAGVIIGCILSLALGAKLSAVFSMSRLPLAYLTGGVIALWVIGLLAVLIPARRAAAISPAVATRSV